MRSAFLTAGLLLAVATGARAQITSPADSLTADLTRLFAATDLPGFAVAVVDAQGIRYEHGFGQADRATAQAFTSATVGKVGSVSKTLIGLCLLKGVELGYFTLDTPINDLLPWAVRNPHRPEAVIRIHHLATHTAGIVDHERTYLGTYRFGERGARMRFDAAAPPDQQSAPVLGTFLQAYFTKGSRQHFAAALPGDAYRYSNIGAALAAYLLEQKSGLSYADFARRYVLTPAGMTASGWSYAEIAGQPLATGYRQNGKSYDRYLCLTYPDGGLHASAHDLALYLQQVIRGTTGQSPLLTLSSFQELLAPQFAATGAPAGRNPREPNSGLFWAIRSNGQVGHLGSDPGAFAALFFDPRTGIGKVFLTNIDFDDSPALTQQFAAIWRTLESREKRVK